MICRTPRAAEHPPYRYQNQLDVGNTDFIEVIRRVTRIDHGSGRRRTAERMTQVIFKI